MQKGIKKGQQVKRDCKRGEKRTAASKRDQGKGTKGKGPGKGIKKGEKKGQQVKRDQGKGIAKGD